MLWVSIAIACADTNGPNGGFDAEGAYRLTAVGEQHSYPAFAYVVTCSLGDDAGVDSMFVVSAPTGRLDLTNPGGFQVSWSILWRSVSPLSADTTTHVVSLDGSHEIAGYSMHVSEPSDRVQAASFVLDERRL